MEQQNSEFKRNVAHRLRIGEILKGKEVSENEKFLYLDLEGKKISRINLIANCIDRYIQDDEKKFASITVDDATGQIKLKTFGDDIESLKQVKEGDTLQIIGTVRAWNQEIYILPEVVKVIDPRWLLARKLEIQNKKSNNSFEEKDKSNSLKDNILQKIKDEEVNGGLDTDKLKIDLDVKESLIEVEIKKLLEEGLIYEPRPGRLRYLG